MNGRQSVTFPPLGTRSGSVATPGEIRIGPENGAAATKRDSRTTMSVPVAERRGREEREGGAERSGAAAASSGGSR